MKKLIFKTTTIIILSLTVILSACEKDEDDKTYDWKFTVKTTCTGMPTSTSYSYMTGTEKQAENYKKTLEAPITMGDVECKSTVTLEKE